MTHTKSPLAAASFDFYNKKSVEKLWIETNYNTTEEMPTEVFFRGEDNFYELEYDALEICNGSVLDIGAGVGSHALFLQAQGFSVTALEIDVDLVKIMRVRGVENVICKDVYKLEGKKYDTLLLLMNGIGLVGDLRGIEKFLVHAKTLLNDGGQMLFDSRSLSDFQHSKDIRHQLFKFNSAISIFLYRNNDYITVLMCFRCSDSKPSGF